MQIHNISEWISEKVWGHKTETPIPKDLTSALHAIHNTSHANPANPGKSENSKKVVVQKEEPKDGERHEKGVLRLKHGVVYKGEVKNGKPHGEGILRFKNGTTYDGKFKDGIMHGHGVLCLNDGSTYNGEFRDGKMHGHGVLRSMDGNTYDGEFRDGEMHGNGVLRRGIVYKGQVENGKAHGRGVLRSRDDDTYDGNFRNGQAYGKGTITCFVEDRCYSYQFDPDESYSSEQLRDLCFLKLLIAQGEPVTSMHEFEIILKWLESKPQYQEIANKLASVKRIFALSSDAYKTEAMAILTDLHKGRSRLLPFGFNGHRMGLNLVPREPGFIDCEIFNSGEGVHLHPCQWRPRKYQTMMRIKVPIANMTPEILINVLDNDAIPDYYKAYALIRTIPGAIQVNIQPPEQVWQSVQKGSDCSIRWVFAYLKNSLGADAYKKLRRDLFTECLEALKKSPYQRIRSLENELIRKIAKRS